MAEGRRNQAWIPGRIHQASGLRRKLISQERDEDKQDADDAGCRADRLLAGYARETDPDARLGAQVDCAELLLLCRCRTGH